MASIELNGVTLEYNFLDADQTDKFVEEMQKVVVEAENSKMTSGKFTKVGDSIRYQIKLIEDFFDACFGEGISKKLFPDNSDLKPRLEGFAAMRDLYGQANDETNNIVAKYSPSRVPDNGGNRQQRRANKKHRR